MRLIDADALIKDLDDAIQDAKSKGEICDYWEDDRSNLLSYLDTAPTVDAVEVVRCRECKYRETCEQIVWFDIGKYQAIGSNIDFCSYGEREGE